jgi:hypothetical protein
MIKKIAAQALDKAVPYTWTTLNYDQIQELLKVHGELIVQECANRASWAQDTGEKDIPEGTRTRFEKCLNEAIKTIPPSKLEKFKGRVSAKSIGLI